MGLKRNGDLYGLKATCARKTRSQQSDERETTKRNLIKYILKEKDSRKKRKLRSTSTCSSSPTATGETSSKRPKIRRISLGLMLFDEGKGKFVTVRYSRSGGTRSLDVPLLLTKQELIEEGTKHSFQMVFLKLEIRLIIHLTEHVSVAKLLIKSKTVMDKKSRFTVKGYFECFKFREFNFILGADDGIIQMMTISL